ncbi:hypothetical protein J3A64_001850 [Pseudarthrobacter sp. PvP004]|nr:hypothetical protein [Pseudarthrobacter sp. PvP004]
MWSSVEPTASARVDSKLIKHGYWHETVKLTGQLPMLPVKQITLACVKKKFHQTVSSSAQWNIELSSTVGGGRIPTSQGPGGEHQ